MKDYSTTFICEFCGKENSEKYQTGRFCSSSCKSKWVSRNNKGRKRIRKCKLCGKEELVSWLTKIKDYICKNCQEKIEKEEYEKNPKRCKKCNNNIEFKKRNGIFCSYKCSNSHLYSQENRKRLSDSMKKTYNEHPEIRLAIKEKLTGRKLSEEEKTLRRSKRRSSKEVKKELKDILIEETNNKCMICGYDGYFEKRKSKTILEIHHIDGDPKNNEMTNVQLLCLNCHAKTDSYRRNTGNKMCTKNKERNIKFIADVKECYNNSTIDFSKETWKKELSSYRNLDEQPQTLIAMMKKNLLKFFIEECFEGKLLKKI